MLHIWGASWGHLGTFRGCLVDALCTLFSVQPPYEVTGICTHSDVKYIGINN